MDHRRLFAGIVRGWLPSKILNKVAVQKVTAHTGGESLAERGNERADEVAKERVRAQALVNHETCKDHLHRTMLAVNVVKYAGQALPLFPSIKEMCVASGVKKLPRCKGERVGGAAAGRLHIAHQWSEAVGVDDSKYRICLACGRRAKTNFDSECTGKRPWLVQAAEEPKGHTLWVAGVAEREGDLVVLCSGCGRREVGASGRAPFWTLGDCNQCLEGNRADQKRRFFQGRHPDPRIRASLTPPFRLGEAG